ncbi:MAG: hypothetical protein WCA97_11645 [Terriglobales bacterium]|jgi:hypothetical protein
MERARSKLACVLMTDLLTAKMTEAEIRVPKNAAGILETLAS